MFAHFNKYTVSLSCVPGMALGARTEYRPSNVFSWKKRENIKNARRNITKCKIFCYLKWLKIGFSFVLQFRDHFNQALKCKFYKVMLITFYCKN